MWNNNVFSAAKPAIKIFKVLADWDRKNQLAVCLSLAERFPNINELFLRELQSETEMQ